MFQLVQLGQERVDHLHRVNQTSEPRVEERDSRQGKGVALARNASEGSVPLIAPALAAVRLSTSSAT